MNQEKVSIGLENPKSPDNVSSVMRAAGNYQVDSILYTGTRYPRALSYQVRSVDMSRKVSKGVSVSGVECLINSVPEGMSIVCVELVVNATPLPEFEHPENAFYIFGPEDGSISQGIIDKADSVVYVPTVGCMNLAASVNVLLYDRLAKNNIHATDNDLVRKSRDTNNRLKTPL
ncbi:MAG: TrmH family RNA methyltransferase [Gammaproteobacteria bacterium]|nr:TrmH family RNA methyltransferase [Gammaproteobacteria bacterium]